MLTKATLEDVERYCDLAYSLATDQTRSCYPTYADGFKTKADFISAARRDVAEENRELLLFSLNGTVEGWIGYYWVAEDRYLQLVACNIRQGTRQALAELLALLPKRFPGYSLHFGFSADNTEAIRFLQENSFRCIEDDWNYSFFFDSYVPRPEDAHISRITRDNYGDFRAVYGQDDGDTYWNCDRILEHFDRWTIFAYYEDAKPVGAIFLRDGSSVYPEICGVVFDGGYREDAYRELLTAALNHCKGAGAKHMTFICEEEVRSVVQELGFRCVGRYVCFAKTI